MIDPLAKARVGDEIVYDKVGFFYMRRTPDGRVMAMSSHGELLEIPDPETGFPMMPRPADVVAAMATQRLFLRSDPLDDPVRADARAEEPAISEIFDEERNPRADEGASLRNAVVRAWDRLTEADRPSMSDEPLEAWVTKHPDMKKARAAYGRVPRGSTIRDWIRHRGRKNDRRAVDMVSRRGKVARSRRFPDLVIQLGKLHAIAHAVSERPTSVQFTRFKRDVAKANRGEVIKIGGEEFVYKRPETAVRHYQLTIFRLECRKARSMKAEEARRGPGARKQNFGGGGFSEEPVRYLQTVQQDDSPFSQYFLIDPHRRVPVGMPTVVITLEIYCAVILGWDVSYDDPSTSTWLRALAHCAMPKPVPDFLEKDFSGVGDLYGYIRGNVVYDNALQNIGHAAEDAAGDLAHGIRIAGENQPTHKGKVERVIQTIQGYMKAVPATGLDVRLMRRFGYDPRKHVVMTLDGFRKALDEAIATYHTQRSAPLGGRSPLQVWEEQVALHGHDQPKDVDMFLRSIGDVHEVTVDRTGFVVPEFDLRFTLGTQGNEQLLSDFAAALGAPAGDGPQSYRAKVKTYDTVEVASIHNPLTRRYVEVPCAMRRYGKDMPVKHHQRIRKFVALTKAEFRTEEQMEDARDAFYVSLEEAIPEATARQNRVFAGLVDAPNVRRFLGSDVVLRTVEPSASGMADDVVHHSSRAGSRGRTATAAPRPKRGGKNVRRAEEQAAAEQRSIAQLARRAADAQRRAGGDAAGQAASVRRKPPVVPSAPLDFDDFDDFD